MRNPLDTGICDENLTTMGRLKIDQDKRKEELNALFNKHRDMIDRLIYEGQEARAIAKQVTNLSGVVMPESLIRNRHNELMQDVRGRK